MNTEKLTVEQLKEHGWVSTPEDAPVCVLEKKIPNCNPLNASEDTNISLIVHGMYNEPQFAVLLPDGGMLNFNFETLEQLQLFEKMIAFYDAPF